MAYTLSGVWKWKDTISGGYEEGSGNTTVYVSFKSNGTYFARMQIPKSNGVQLIYFTNDLQPIRAWYDGDWLDANLQTIYFTQIQTVSEEFYNWFTANATYIGESEPEEPTTDTKPVYKRVNGAWVKQTAYQRVNGEWVKISSAE